MWINLNLFFAAVSFIILIHVYIFLKIIRQIKNFLGMWPSGKASEFEPDIQRFESFYPSFNNFITAYLLGKYNISLFALVALATLAKKRGFCTKSKVSQKARVALATLLVSKKLLPSKERRVFGFSHTLNLELELFGLV